MLPRISIFLFQKQRPSSSLNMIKNESEISHLSKYIFGLFFLFSTDIFNAFYELFSIILDNKKISDFSD
ncbi:MULE domain-containing protein [Aphis craccivora]|uniref:MULE domain-containing protein n=1 Tax=Aphis craccivora TaxID=307492 RepID=A0A6G0Z7C7_APHCR|nr:MULE domain-containing protein [Aphis craccivora]